MSSGVEDMYGSTGNGTRAIIFPAGGYSTVDGHTVKNMREALGIMRSSFRQEA